MTGITLEGSNLGEKHKHLNSLVNDTVSKQVPFETILSELGDSDVDNLIKIDIASHYRNVDYIVEILKSEDMLYVSRAIKKSPWLVTEQQYAHIVNPQHLHTQLFPHMITKAFNKLMLHIRLHLKDEKIVDEFFKYLKDKDIKQALKWLPYCSKAVVEDTIAKHASLITHQLFKKTCERHTSVFDKFIEKRRDIYYKPYLKSVVYLLNSDTKRYLEKLESLDGYYWPEFSKRSTAAIMKNCPDRILNKMFEYIFNLNVETVAKHIEPDKTKDVILSILKNKNLTYWFTYKNISSFIKQMPKKGKFTFVKNIFIDKIDIDPDSILIHEDMKQNSLKPENMYQWYRHAPFSIAYPYLTQMIKTVPSPYDRTDILKIMLTTAGRDEANLLELLKYYHKCHINELFLHKISFINSFIQVSDTHKYDKKSWDLINSLFQSAEVYTSLNEDVQNCLHAIIVYNILNQKYNKSEYIIEKNFIFNSLKKYKSKLTENEGNEIINFLLNSKLNQMSNEKITSKEQLHYLKLQLDDILDLLKDWDKDLLDYERVIKEIKRIITIKHENGFDVNLANIYNKNKSWRKILFEDSILLSQGEETFLNALKHDPDLLSRHLKQVELIRCDNSVVLYRFLTKLRIYWANNYAANWANVYRRMLKQTNSNKAVIRGVSTLIPTEKLSDIFDEYAPVNAKSCSETDEQSIAFIKHFINEIHIARPQPSPELVFRYAFGEYIQFAMPSLNSILFNMSPNRYRDYLSQLLCGDDALQKLGIQIAFVKLQTDELGNIFKDTWKTNKSASVRALIFQKSFKLLCQEKDIDKIEELWALLDMFIDNLTDEESPSIYKYLCLVDKVPNHIRTQFAMKSYTFLKSLPAKCNCHVVTEKVARSTANLMDTINLDLVVDIILEFIDTWLVTRKVFSRYPDYPDYVIEIVANFILSVNTEEDFNYRYERAFKPWLHSIFSMWSEISDNDNVVEDYFERFLQTTLEIARRNSLSRKYINPAVIFKRIKLEIENSLPHDQTYFILTFCKLSVAYFQCYEKIKAHIKDVDLDSEEDVRVKHKEMWINISPLYAIETLNLLNEDIDKLFSSILFVFTKCLLRVLKILRKDIEVLPFERELIKDKSNERAYLLTIKILPNFECIEECEEIRRQIVCHPSLEVRIHYYKRFSDSPLSVATISS